MGESRPELPSALFRRWVHVREEDSADIRVYRPADRPLPPARGRDGIEFHPDGTFVDWEPGPVDAPVTSGEKTWTTDGTDTVRLRDRAGRTAVVLKIAAVTDDVLRLRTMPG
jgi:hypothetical protein